MTLPKQSTCAPRSRVKRSWCVGVAAGAALLLPVSGASATHMVDANGMACPHASGEGPNALPPAGPSESGAPERAPSEAPLGTAGRTTPSAPAASRPSSPAAQVTKPATQVTKPAVQVPAQRPATKPQAASVGVSAEATTKAVARTTVKASAGREQPRAAKATARRGSRAEPRRTSGRTSVNGLEPRAAVATVSSDPSEAQAAPPAGVATLTISLALLALASLGGLAAVVLRRRRGAGGAALAAPPVNPVAPAHADAIDAELHEIISEARARTLLAGEADETPDPLEPVSSR